MIMNRKGITPIIAVVLLLMMTVAAAGAAFFWITTIQSRIQGQIGTQVSTTTSQTGSGLNILALICVNASNNMQYINITLQNTGTSTIPGGTGAIAILDNQNKIIKVGVISNNTVGGNFDQNNIRTLNLNLTNITAGVVNLYPNNTFGIKLTLPGGIEGTGDCIVRQL